MLYYLIRPLARIGIWMFYRKIRFSNVQHLPVDRPVILAANHPTGFMEPCILAVFLRRPLYYLVRGDFFQKPIYNFLLRSLNMIPIFRKIDGSFRDLKTNFSTFEACYEALNAHKTMVIYPEGSAIYEKRLRPLQKGLSRIAFGFLERFPEAEDLLIVPTAVNYTYGDRARSEVMVDFGAPISVREILNAHEGHPKQALHVLTDQLTEALSSRLVDIQEPEKEEITEYALQLGRSSLYRGVFPVFSHDVRPLEEELRSHRAVEGLTLADREQALNQCRIYFGELGVAGLQDWVWHRQRPSFWLTSMVLVWSAPLAAAGYLFCFPPAAYAEHITRTRVTRTEFVAPVLLATNLGLFILYYLIWLLVTIISGTWWLFPLTLLLGWLGYASFLWREKRQEWLIWQRFGRLTDEEKQALETKRKYCLEALFRENTSR